MFFIILAISLFIADLFIKKYVEKKIRVGSSKEILKDKVDIMHVHNKGIMMSMLEEKRKIIDGVSLMAIGALIIVFFQTICSKGSKMAKVGISFMMAGALSNVYERIFKGYVVDYINVKKCKRLKKIVFNLADVFLFVGGIISIIASIFGKNK